MTRPVDPPAGERIAKLLARAGVASRREVERMIAEGRVALNGVALDTPATVLASLAGVTVDGEPVAAPEPTRLFLYHKPVGLLVAERDPKDRATIYDRLPADLPRVVPVGRLDLNTEGLLLLTTDGGFKRQLELPATGVERAYRARAYGQVTQGQLEGLIEGVEIEGVRYGPIDANLERRTGANVWVELILTEGKNREVRRVLEYLGLQVSRLIRTRYGPFVLGDLPPGEVGEVRAADLIAFRRTLKGGAPLEPIAAEPRAGFRVAPKADRATRTKRAKPSLSHPGEGRGPVAAQSDRRSPRDGITKRAPSRIPYPGAGRGPVAMHADQRAPRGDLAERRSPQLDPGLRRGGKEVQRSGEGADTMPPEPPRPAKPQRKPGWARAKPRPGPGRPRKPRA